MRGKFLNFLLIFTIVGTIFYFQNDKILKLVDGKTNLWLFYLVVSLLFSNLYFFVEFFLVYKKNEFNKNNNDVLLDNLNETYREQVTKLKNEVVFYKNKSTDFVKDLEDDYKKKLNEYKEKTIDNSVSNDLKSLENKYFKKMDNIFSDVLGGNNFSDLKLKLDNINKIFNLFMVCDYKEKDFFESIDKNKLVDFYLCNEFFLKKINLLYKYNLFFEKKNIDLVKQKITSFEKNNFNIVDVKINFDFAIINNKELYIIFEDSYFYIINEKITDFIVKKYEKYKQIDFKNIQENKELPF